jgi:hypothetical protein
VTNHAPRTASWTVAGFLSAALVILALFLLIQSLGASRQNGEFLRILTDCTTPRGECATSIRRVSAVVASCADQPGAQSAREVEACVDRHLSDLEK